MSTFLYLSGVGAFIVGCYLAWHPLGWIVGGIIGVTLSMVLDRASTPPPVLDQFGRQSDDDDDIPDE